MNKQLKHILTAFLIGILGISIGGCNDTVSTTSKDSSHSSNKTVIKFGETGWKNYETLLEAAGLNDFKDYEVEYSLFQGGNLCLEALAADEIDFTTTSEIPPISASLADNGGNFKIVLINSTSPQNQEVVALEKSNIKTIKDLKGKKVGYIKNTTAQYFLNVMLYKADLRWNDITPVEITTADGVTALISGEIDAFASYGNSINSAKNNGAVTVDSAIDILSGNFPIEVSNTALANKEKTKAIADYLARVQKAWDWAKNHLEEWANIQAEPTGNTYEEALDLLQRTYEDRGYLYRLLLIDESVIKSEQSVADVFFNLGAFDKKITASTFYDQSFGQQYKKALERLKNK